MTTASAVKPSDAPAKILDQGLFPIDKIDVVSNIRKTMSPAKLKELVESVRSRGVNQPILLRPSAEKGRYIVVAGHRRLKAAQEAGLIEIPAIVKDLDADDALVDQAIENLQREEVGVIEEARGFRLLTQPGKDGAAAKYTVDQVADLVDKSLTHVYRSMSLLGLPEAAIAAIESGQFSPAHGIQILRVPPDDREKLTKAALEREMTAANLRYHVEAQLGKDLDGAHFPKNKPYAGMQACTTCPSNTGNQGALFDGAEKGQCMDGGCFAKKVKEHRDTFLEKLRLSNLDAKFVEFARHVWMNMTHAGGYVVTGVRDAKKPPKGDYGLLVTSEFTVYVAQYDKKQAANEKAVDAAPKPENPREKFVASAIGDAMMEAAAAVALKLKPEHKDWVELAKKAADDVPNRLWAGILGVDPDAGDDGDFAKAPEAKLRAIVLINNRLPWHPGDGDFKKLGIDVAKVKKAAKAEAEKAWDEGWGRKHKSIANGGSEVACGIKGLNYKEPTEKGIAVPTIEETNCPDCKAEEKRLRTVSR